MKKMNKILVLGVFAAIIAFTTSCGYDNYNEPNIYIKGQVVAEDGSAIGLQTTSLHSKLDFYQYDDYPKTGSFPVWLDQDGFFATKLYLGGKYKVIHPNNRGPWRQQIGANPSAEDTMTLVVTKGATDLKYVVHAYYTLSNPVFTVGDNAEGKKVVRGTCDIKTHDGSVAIDKVKIYVGENAFIDNNDEANREKADIAVVGSKMEGEVALKDRTRYYIWRTQSAYARLGLKLVGREERDMVFTQVVKLTAAQITELGLAPVTE